MLLILLVEKIFFSFPSLRTSNLSLLVAYYKNTEKLSEYSQMIHFIMLKLFLPGRSMVKSVKLS